MQTLLSVIFDIDMQVCPEQNKTFHPKHKIVNFKVIILGNRMATDAIFKKRQKIDIFDTYDFLYAIFHPIVIFLFWK